MADWPRWIVSWRVDSIAMYGAYLSWVSKAGDPEPQAMLTMVLHQTELDASCPASPHVKEKNCEHGERCRRCHSGEGGYMFRWYSSQWEEKYVELMREGSWKPGDDKTKDGPLKPL